MELSALAEQAELAEPQAAAILVSAGIPAEPGVRVATQPAVLSVATVVRAVQVEPADSVAVVDLAVPVEPRGTGTQAALGYQLRTEVAERVELRASEVGWARLDRAAVAAPAALALGVRYSCRMAVR